MSDIKDMIRSAFDGKANEFNDKFDSIMSSKMDAALSAKYDSMYGEEELDEDELNDDIDDPETNQ